MGVLFFNSLIFLTPRQNMVIFNWRVKLFIFSSTALADFVAGCSSGRAIPAILAPKAKALAM